MVKRSVYAKFPNGHEDEQFWFLHIDCQYSMMLMRLGIKHALVPQAIVSHNHEQSHEPMPIHMEWSKESTRRFFFKFGSDFGVWATGNHAGCWNKEVIFDPEWRNNYQKATGLIPNYGEEMVSQARQTSTQAPLVASAANKKVWPKRRK